MKKMTRLDGFRAAVCAGVLVASAALALPGDVDGLCCETITCANRVLINCSQKSCSTSECCFGKSACSPVRYAKAWCGQCPD